MAILTYPGGNMGPVRNGIFYFWIFFNETWHVRRWASKNNNLKVSLKSLKK
jgi:hypothetical protein